MNNPPNKEERLAAHKAATGRLKRLYTPGPNLLSPFNETEFLLGQACNNQVPFNDNPFMSCYAAYDVQMMTQLASCDPLAYFHVVEASCRVVSSTMQWSSRSSSRAASRLTRRDDCPAEEYLKFLFFHSWMLRLPALLAADSKQQLLLSWQHYKAYTAAFASWVKAWEKFLLEGCVGQRVLLSDAMVLLHDLLGWFLCDVNQLLAVSIGGGSGNSTMISKFSDVYVPAALAGIQLVLLLWVARAIAAARCLLPGALTEAAEGGSSKSSSSMGSGSGSSSKMERRQREAAKGLAVGRKSLNGLAAAGVLYWCCLVLWEDTAWDCFGDGRTGAPPPFHARDAIYFAGAAAPGAATAAAANADEQLSKRLLLLPRDSLTPAVRTQMSVMRQMTRFCSHVAAQDEIDIFVEGLSDAQLGDLLVEVVKLSELMLAEVPCTMGCSNPLCTNLSGVSEMEVKAGSRKTVLKACTACNVVWYCSRECQVAHWKVHQPLCKRLQQQQQQKEEEQEGQQVAEDE